MSSVFDLMATLSLDSSQYSSQLAAAEGQATGFGGKAGGAFTTLGSKAKVAMLAAGAAVVGFGTSAIKTGMQFDSSMSQVMATMGYSVQELHTAGSQAANDYQKLSDFAKQMGATTKFSASEAADALNYMALAGYDATTSMDMLPTVLNLAAAGNMDLAYASDVVTDAQSALGLSLDETTALVDQMAKASSITNTSVSQLGEALLTVGGTAKILSGGTAEASAALGLLASAGVKGSEGGTALRNILLGISSSKFEKSFGALGVSAYDAEGNMRSLKDVFADMNTAMEGMTVEEKTELISKAFNKLDLKSVNALLGVNAEQWAEVEASIADSTGAAEDMAEVQLDNLEGKVTLLKSAFEGLQIAVSGKVAPALTSLVGGLGDMFGDLATTIDSGGGLQGAFNVVVRYAQEAVNSVINVMGSMASAIAAHGGEMISAFLSNLTTLSSRIRESAGNLVDAGINLALSIAKGIADGIPTMIQTIPTIVSNIAGIINDNAPKLLAAGVKIIITLAKGIIQAIPTLIANIPKILKSIWDVWMAFSWGSLGGKLIDGIKSGMLAVGKNLPSMIKNLFGSIRDVIINIKWSGVGNTILELLMTGLRAIGTKFVPFLKNELSSGIDAAKAIDWAGVGLLIVTKIGGALASAGSFIVDALGNLLGKAVEFADSIDWASVGTTIASALGTAMEFLFVTIPEKLVELGGKIIEVLSGIDWLSVGTSIVTFIVNGITSLAGMITSVLSYIGNAAITAFQSVNWAGVGSAVISFIVNGISGLFSLIPSALSAIGNAAMSLFRSIPWSSLGSAVINLIRSGISALGSIIGSALRTIGSNAMNAFKSLSWSSIGTQVINGIANGIRNGATAVVNAAKNVAKNAFDAAKNFLKIQSPSKLFQDKIGKMMALGMGIGFETGLPIKSMKAALGSMVNALKTNVSVGMDSIKSAFEDIEDLDIELPDMGGQDEYEYDLVGTPDKSVSGEGEASNNTQIEINVYPSAGQDEKAIADMVAERLGTMYKRRRLTYA